MDTTQVVIIEDDPMVAQINKQYISQVSGLKLVGIFANGLLAINFIQKYKVDLVLLDVYMPELNGLDLLKKMRHLGLATAVIMVTAANDPRQVDELLRLGVIDYLVKPFSEARFKEALAKYFARKQALNTQEALSQQTIDKLMGQANFAWVQSSEPMPSTPKGLQPATLKLVLKTLALNPRVYLGCEEIAEKVGLSKVTVRRYLNHLAGAEAVETTIDYDTGGRPSVKFRLK
ncbi:MAG: response regulator [Deltaproteobacteria bacterium]|jgi:response regulator of citrate/malate metabolism|nr:response regulator [Deltaproteobacteria bacterium]